MGDSIINKVDHGMSTTDKNRGCSRKGRKCHGLWHRRGCSCARGNEQCREEGNVGHRWQVKEVGQEEARIEQILLSGILPVMVGKGQEHRNCRRMAINTPVQEFQYGGGSRLRRYVVTLCVEL